MSEYLLGLELSGSQLKIACFKRIGKTYRLQTLDSLELLIDSDQALENLLSWKSKLGEDAQISAFLALSESSIYLREVKFPQLDQAQLEQAIHWEISSIAPISASEASFEAITPDATQPLRKVVMVVRDEHVDRIFSIFEKAGIRLFSIEPSSMSFARVADADFERTTLLVVVEENETDFVVLKQGVPVFSTSVSVKLSGMEGAKRKLDTEISNDLADNAKRIIAFWEDREQQMIRQVIITGDIVKRYTGLAKAINEIAHIPVLLGKGKKLQSVSFHSHPQASLNRYFVPIGSALKYFAGSKEFNLFPKREKLRLKKQQRQDELVRRIRIFNLINAVFLLIMIMLSLLFKFWQSALAGDIAQTQQFIQNHPAQKHLQQVQDTNRLLANLEKISVMQKDQGERLRKIASLTPATVVFTSIEFKQAKDEEWKVTGIADRTDVLAFYEKMVAESGADQVGMPYSNLSKEKANEFSINIVWKN